MSRRVSITASDAAQLIELVLSACEAHRRRNDRVKFILIGLNRMIGTRFAIASEYPGAAILRPISLLPVASEGELLTSESDAIAYYIAQGDHESDPALAAYRLGFRERYRRGELLWYATKGMLVQPRAWYTHDHVTDVRKTANLDEFAYGGFLGSKPDLMHGLSVHRAWGERELDRRELALVQALHMGMRQLLELPDNPSPFDKLSPRQKQIAQRLLAGESVKQAAAALGLTVSTTSTYLRAMHRKLGVSSRGELLALLHANT